MPLKESRMLLDSDVKKNTNMCLCWLAWFGLGFEQSTDPFIVSTITNKKFKFTGIPANCIYVSFFFKTDKALPTTYIGSD